MKHSGASFVALEIVAGGVSASLAVVGTYYNVYDISFIRSVIAGLAGFSGAYIFLRKVGFVLDKDKFIAIATGGGMASLFGPLVSNASWWHFEFIPQGNLFVDAAAGAVLGLASTPILAFCRDPVPTLDFLIQFIPWMKKL